jgi:hypothetical protein
LTFYGVAMFGIELELELADGLRCLHLDLTDGKKKKKDIGNQFKNIQHWKPWPQRTTMSSHSLWRIVIFIDLVEGQETDENISAYQRATLVHLGHSTGQTKDLDASR